MKIKIFLIVIALSYFSGWREVGIDRESYITMHRLVVDSTSLASKMFYAKDFIFFLAVELATIFSDDPKLTFLFICFLSILTKFIAFNNINEKFLLQFLVLYAVFASPRLEFTAIRAGLAIGFFMLAITFREKNIIYGAFSLLSVASHISLFIPVIFSLKPFNDLISRNKFFWNFIIFFFVFFFTGFFLDSGFDRLANYEDNVGTLKAFFPVFAVYITTNLIFFRFDRISISLNRKEAEVLTIIRDVVFNIISLCFGIVPHIVTASTRYLEIAWCLLILSGVCLHKKHIANLSGLLLLIFILSYINIDKKMWMVIIYPYSYF